MTSSDLSLSKINASVSKSFFVEMLIKDINLQMAIHDLIDNCIDGARKLRGESRFDGLEVDIKLSNTEFSIKDNCGGIDKDTAINYAFRFGRPKEVEGVQHSIGRFGVGMKRAIFKLGRQFSILSTSELDTFEVEVDVPSWEQNNNWEFEFKSLSTVEVPLSVEQRGTTIRVTNLFQSVAEQFSLVYFENNFNKQIASRYQEYLEHGLSIRVNNISIISAPVRYLTYLSNLKAAFQEEQYDDVSIRLIVGVGEPKPADAGWYVYCNGRMILRADQSDTTGWGEAGIDRIPRLLSICEMGHF